MDFISHTLHSSQTVPGALISLAQVTSSISELRVILLFTVQIDVDLFLQSSKVLRWPGIILTHYFFNAHTPLLFMPWNKLFG